MTFYCLIHTKCMSWRFIAWSIQNVCHGILLPDPYKMYVMTFYCLIHTKCISWRFIAWSIQNSAMQPLWDNGTIRQQASNMSMVCSSKNAYMFLIFYHSELRPIPIGSWHSWTKWQILCFTTVTVPPDQWKWHAGILVLLTWCLAAWTKCWLYHSVQKYCCTVRS